MTNPKLNPLVRVVDDEESVRDSRRFVLTLAGFEVACYSNGDDFLARDDFRRPGCLILDLQMPGMSGLEVQSELSSGHFCYWSWGSKYSCDSVETRSVRFFGKTRRTLRASAMC